ncbi:MAG: hypothetical protein DRN04_11590 [Thermoprotei archaeon]|nr:MAG: hypothetical protein DRN04_11590 [Thermoprotei archaeon]
MAETVFIEKFLTRLAISMFIALVTLTLVGEKRVDVYVTVFILIYFILLALYSPLPKEVEKGISVISKILITIFIIIISFRILEIIAPTIIISILRP